MSTTEVSIDFLELDHMRETVKGFIKRIHTKKAYEYSAFYVGRSVSRFVFSDIKVTNRNQLNRLIAELKNQFSDSNYKYYVIHGTTLIVYVRGDRKE